MAIYEKKVSVGAWAKKGEDIKDGDIVKVANEGQPVEGNFGVQNVFLVKLTSGEDKNVSFNQTSINNMIDAYGKDSVKWIGKESKVWFVRQSVAGKLTSVMYFSHPNAELTDDGFVLPNEGKSEDIPF